MSDTPDQKGSSPGTHPSRTPSSAVEARRRAHKAMMQRRRRRLYPTIGVLFVVVLLLILWGAGVFGGGSSSSTSSTTPTSEPGTEPTGTAGFIDVPTDYPYAQAIAGLVDQSIANGTDATHFAPEQPLTRAGFAKWALLALRIPADDGNYLATAEERGILSTGASASDSLSRAQLVSAVVRAVDDLHPTLLEEADETGTWEDFDPVHGTNAAKAELNGLLAGLPLSTLDPWGTVTRGEAAQIINNLTTKLPSE